MPILRSIDPILETVSSVTELKNLGSGTNNVAPTNNEIPALLRDGNSRILEQQGN